jgi:predicted ATPase
LRDALKRLVDSELIFEHGHPPTAEYLFKHALIQDVAYGTLLRSTRRRLHARIAEVLETGSPDLMDSQPELLAHHLTASDNIQSAVEQWLKAGKHAAARSANQEAIAQLERGLRLLTSIPESFKRQRRELEFRNALIAVLHSVKGNASIEAGQASTRAQELWEQLGSPAEFLQVPYGLARYHMYRGELDLAQRVNEEMVRLSHERNDAAGLVLGHTSSGGNLSFAGEFVSSRWHLERVFAIYDPIAHVKHGQEGIHQHVLSMAFLSVVLFCLGFPDQALAQSNAAIAEARRLAHWPSLAGSLALSVRLLSLVGDDRALDERAKQLVAVASEQGFSFWHAQGAIYRGWIEVRIGDLTTGTALLRDGLTAYRVTGGQLYLPHYTFLLAAACLMAGHVEQALDLLNDALEIVERTGERWFATELNRHKGELLLHQGDPEAAEDLYRKALSIAKDQGAKLWELRATASLARLRRDQGRRTDAHDLLAPVYNWFTEGFDTPDLKEAKALLAELAWDGD